MKDKINIGIIGTGRIGKMHAEILTSRVPGARVHTVTDVNRESAEQCAKEYEIANVADSHLDILKDEEIDGVAICSSTDTHAQMICDAADSGKHIFCEKPIDYDLSRIDEALGKVKKAGVKLQIGFQRRFDINFLKTRKMIQEGSLGQPYVLRITSRDPAPSSIEYIKVSGGLFFDMMIHDFDMSRYLIGSEVEEVYAIGKVNVDPEIGKVGDIDTAVVTLQFSNNTVAVIDCCRKSGYGYDQRVEAFGSGGLIRVENETESKTSFTNNEAVHLELPPHFFIERYYEAYVREMKEFILCIQEDKIPSVTGKDGRAPVVLAMAAKKSLMENRPVRTDEID